MTTKKKITMGMPKVVSAPPTVTPATPTVVVGGPPLPSGTKVLSKAEAAAIAQDLGKMLDHATEKLDPESPNYVPPHYHAYGLGMGATHLSNKPPPKPKPKLSELSGKMGVLTEEMNKLAQSMKLLETPHPITASHVNEIAKKLGVPAPFEQKALPGPTKPLNAFEALNSAFVTMLGEDKPKEAPPKPPEPEVFAYQAMSSDEKIEHLGVVLKAAIKQSHVLHDELYAVVQEHKVLVETNKQLQVKLEQASKDQQNAQSLNNQLTNAAKSLKIQLATAENDKVQSNEKLSKVCSEKTNELTALQDEVDELHNAIAEAEKSKEIFKKSVDQTLATMEAKALKTIEEIHADAKQEINGATKEAVALKFKISQLEEAMQQALALNLGLDPGSTADSAFKAVECAMLKTRDLRGQLLAALVAEALEADNEEPDWTNLPVTWNTSLNWGAVKCPSCAADMTPIESHKNGNGFQCSSKKCGKLWKDAKPSPSSIKKTLFDRVQAVQALVLELGHDIDMAVFAVDTAGARRILDFIKKVPTIKSAHEAALTTWIEETKAGMATQVASKHEVNDAYQKELGKKVAADEKQQSKNSNFSQLYPAQHPDLGSIAKPVKADPSLPDYGTPIASSLPAPKYEIQKVELISDTKFKVIGLNNGVEFTAEVSKPANLTQSAWDKAAKAAVLNPAALSVLTNTPTPPAIKGPTFIETSTVMVPADVAKNMDKPIETILKKPAESIEAISPTQFQAIIGKIKKASKDNPTADVQTIAQKLAKDPDIAMLANSPEVFQKMTNALAKEVKAGTDDIKHLSGTVASMAKDMAMPQTATVSDWNGLYSAIDKHAKKSTKSAAFFGSVKKGKAAAPTVADDYAEAITLFGKAVAQLGTVSQVAEFIHDAGPEPDDDSYNPIDLIPGGK